MRKKIIIIGAIIMAIFAITGCQLNRAFDKDGDLISSAYDILGNAIFPNLPIPTGDLTASQEIQLPDIYGTGKAFTCTGLAYDADNDVFLVGDIGKALPSSTGFASQIVKVTTDFLTVVGTIPLYTAFPNMNDVQGITIDADGTIWFCSPAENLIRHISSSGSSIGSFSVSHPTGIVYSSLDDSFWILTTENTNNIKRVSKTGTVLEQYTFSYNETLDQCFLDAEKGYLYMTAGTNYSGRNNVYLFNAETHQQSITCTVDSYSVEGIWIGTDRMVILNDGYYHSASVPINQANVYELTR